MSGDRGDTRGEERKGENVRLYGRREEDIEQERGGGGRRRGGGGGRGGERHPLSPG